MFSSDVPGVRMARSEKKRSGPKNVPPAAILLKPSLRLFKTPKQKTYSKTVFVKISELTYIYDSKSAQKVSMFFNLFKHMSLKTSGTVPVSGILVPKKVAICGKNFLTHSVRRDF